MKKTHKKPTLELVVSHKEEKKEEPKSLKELPVHSFWNTCGETQEGFPCKVCKEEKVGHEWSINSPEHNNCFWEYVAEQSYPDGYMNPLSQSETAELMGCSPTSVHMLEKSAIEKLKKSPYFELLRDYLTQDPGRPDEADYMVHASYEDSSDQDEE